MYRSHGLFSENSKKWCTQGHSDYSSIVISKKLQTTYFSNALEIWKKIKELTLQEHWLFLKKIADP